MDTHTRKKQTVLSIFFLFLSCGLSFLPSSVQANQPSANLVQSFINSQEAMNFSDFVYFYSEKLDSHTSITSSERRQIARVLSKLGSTTTPSWGSPKEAAAIIARAAFGLPLQTTEVLLIEAYLGIEKKTFFKFMAKHRYKVPNKAQADTLSKKLDQTFSMHKRPGRLLRHASSAVLSVLLTVSGLHPIDVISPSQSITSGDLIEEVKQTQKLSNQAFLGSSFVVMYDETFPFDIHQEKSIDLLKRQAARLELVGFSGKVDFLSKLGNAPRSDCVFVFSHGGPGYLKFA